ncbi:hypothetical protein [Longimycelium tulufanense]|uniref:hypothetical protein n=1 Tax=Longimycelium tulufanense TaxID=907463 RepID=UPI001E624058|nr:hypothetical protein [Longimycelium tulufanense]
MVDRDERREPDPAAPAGLFADELLGLDPDDPEARAFAEHLERMRRVRPSYTVEGYLAGVSDFAESANRARGHRRLVAVVLVGLILLGVAWAVWEALIFVFGTFLAASG